MYRMGSKTGDDLKKMIYWIAISLLAVMRQTKFCRQIAYESFSLSLSFSIAIREILQKEIELRIYSLARAFTESRKESYLRARGHKVSY